MCTFPIKFPNKKLKTSSLELLTRLAAILLPPEPGFTGLLLFVEIPDRILRAAHKHDPRP